MKSNWKECKISDIGTVVGGATPSTKKAENYDGGKIAWITPKDLSTLKGRYIKYGERNITDIGLKSCSTQLLPAKTVLFSSRAPIGYIAIAENEVCTNQGFKSVIPNDNVDALFLFYLLKYNKNKIESMGSGTTFKEVSGTTMKNITVKLPCNVEEQKKIANILGSLDDKIELNQKINENLEEQAQTIFKSWFVDFEPFKDGEFVNSELGQIPKGWKVDTLGSIINISSGKRPLSKINEKTEDYNIPVIGASGVMAYTNNVLTDEKIIVTGRVGTHGVVQKYYKPVWVSDNAFIIKSQYYEFVYQNFKNIDYSSLNRGSTQPLITQTDLKNTLIVIPPEKYLKEFENLISSYFVQSQKLNNENQVLIQIRDTLLPKLMNGEIDVGGVEL